MEKFTKICFGGCVASLCLLIIMFCYGCIYEVHHGIGIIAKTPSLFWMQDLLYIFGTATIIFFILGIVGLLVKDN
jgi:hypothetical protein